MFARSIHLDRSQNDDDSLGWRIRRPRLSLPSPFLLVVLLVFVILPLVWPETGDPLARPDIASRL